LLREFPLKAPRPNTGHNIAAALLAEGAIQSVITLNFDLAFTVALSQLGLGQKVGIVDGQHEFGNQGERTLYYLHGNANTADYESWTIRTAALTSDWKDKWQHVVVNRVVSTPVVLFAGLGSPADVLFESVTFLKSALPGRISLFQVDPSEYSTSTFVNTLGVSQDNYIRLCWCEFMEKLSKRVLVAQVDSIQLAAGNLLRLNNRLEENLAPILTNVKESFSLLEIGALRAKWLLTDNPYLCDDQQTRDHMADLLLVIAYISRESNVTGIVRSDGVVEFVRDGRLLAAYLLASGRGVTTSATIESKASVSVKQIKHRHCNIAGVIMSGAQDNGRASSASPDSIVVEVDPADILFGKDRLKFINAETIRSGEYKISEIVP